MTLDNPVSEKVEALSYSPSVQGSADLEAATKTITATVEATGVVNADYSVALTLAAPSDARLVVMRIASRLAVTIDTIPVNDTNLYCRVYVDAQNANNLLFNENWATVGEKLDAVDTHSGQATIFNLLKNGAAHTFYFFFWRAGTGTGIVISLVQLWEAVGSCATPWYSSDTCLELTHTGYITYFLVPNTQGSGTPTTAPVKVGYLSSYQRTTGYANEPIPVATHLCQGTFSIWIGGTVATDINYLSSVILLLRSEQ